MAQSHRPTTNKKQNQITKWFWKLHHFACKHELVLLLMALNLILRIPNLAEPYWYGDEAIYLTIGTALRNGEILYQTIVDHKTPLIYYLAMVPSQFWFRILLLTWSTLFVFLFYRVATYWLKPKWATLAGILFVLATALPALEGNIPNGELFVIGFVLPGLWLLHQTQWLHQVTPQSLSTKRYRLSTKDLLYTGAAGFLMGLGVLTKVPALLDVGAIGWLLVLIGIVLIRRQPKSWSQVLRQTVALATIFALGVALPLVLSIGYFALRGAFSAYLQYGLLYNLHYSGTWSLPFENPVLVWLFGLPAKAALLALFVGASGLITWFQPKKTLWSWLTVWVVATLVGASLSNRPYPHYLLQVVPPVSLLLIAIWQHSWIQRVLAASSLVLVAGFVYLLNFGMYETVSYYQKYLNMATGKISTQEYRHSFNSLVSQNEQLAETIMSQTPESEPLFIWGTNPMLYALTQRHPATTFTVAFHIHDLELYEQTLQEVDQEQPNFIVIMKNESPLPGLKGLLHEWYRPVAETQDMELYRRSPISRTDLVQ